MWNAVVMNRPTAERLIEAALSFNAAIGRMDSLITEMPEGVEKQSLIKGLGDILFIQLDTFIMPVRREYPDIARKHGYD